MTVMIAGAGIDGLTLGLMLLSDSGASTARGNLVVAADGIHSAVCRQIYPEEGPPLWNGAIL